MHKFRLRDTKSGEIFKDAVLEIKNGEVQKLSSGVHGNVAGPYIVELWTGEFDVHHTDIFQGDNVEVVERYIQRDPIKPATIITYMATVVFDDGVFWLQAKGSTTRIQLNSPTIKALLVQPNVV